MEDFGGGFVEDFGGGLVEDFGGGSVEHIGGGLVEHVGGGLVEELGSDQFVEHIVRTAHSGRTICPDIPCKYKINHLRMNVAPWCYLLDYFCDTLWLTLLFARDF